jgi:hypothetical protein
VGWLATTKTFLPNCLPKMKVPGFESGIWRITSVSM